MTTKYKQTCYRCTCVAAEKWGYIPLCQDCFDDAAAGRIVVINRKVPSFVLTPYTHEKGQ